MYKYWEGTGTYKNDQNEGYFLILQQKKTKKTYYYRCLTIPKRGKPGLINVYDTSVVDNEWSTTTPPPEIIKQFDDLKVSLL